MKATELDNTDKTTVPKCLSLLSKLQRLTIVKNFKNDTDRQRTAQESESKIVYFHRKRTNIILYLHYFSFNFE